MPQQRGQPPPQRGQPPPPGFDEPFAPGLQPVITVPGMEGLDQPASGAAPPNAYPGWDSVVAQGGIGMLKGLASTASGIQQHLRSMDRPRTRQGMDVTDSMAYRPGGITIPPEWTTPENFPQRVGFGAEQAGEYVLGGMGAARLGGSRASQMVMQGMTGAGISGLHGASPEEMLGTGVMAGLVPVVAGKIADRFRESMLGRLFSRMRGTAEPPYGGSYPGEFTEPMDVPFQPVPTPTAPPPRQIGGGQGQLGAGQVIPMPPVPPIPPPQLGPAPSAQPLQAGSPKIPLQLPKAPGEGVPRGTVPLPGDPRLPELYQGTPGPTPPPGTMGRIRPGEPGPIPSHGEQTVTGIRLPLGRVPKGEPGAGRMRPLNESERQQFLQTQGTPGRTAAEPPPAPQPPPRKATSSTIDRLRKQRQEMPKKKPPKKG